MELITFETETGSTYQISMSREQRFVRRVNDEVSKRADGAWLRLHNVPLVAVGVPVTLIMESLSELGPDDYDTRDPDPDYTTRTTSRVARVY